MSTAANELCAKEAAFLRDLADRLERSLPVTLADLEQLIVIADRLEQLPDRLTKAFKAATLLAKAGRADAIGHLIPLDNEYIHYVTVLDDEDN